MKQSVVIIFAALLAFQVFGQEALTHKVSCRDEGYSCTFSVLLERIKLKPESRLTYYWFDGHKLQRNEGGFSGNLLHGTFERKTSEGRLVEKGEFEAGLKVGEWNTWDENGRMIGQENWKEGERKGTSWLLNPETGEKTIVAYKHDLKEGRYFVFKNDSLIERGRYRKGIPVTKKPLVQIKKKKDKVQHPDENKDKQSSEGKTQD